MLEARKSFWFDKIFSIYNRNLMKRRFQGFYIDNLAELTQKKSAVPLVIYANHSSWWDGLIIYEIARIAEINFFVMMEEKQLKNLPLFRKLGAFSVVRENAREALKSVNYAAEILKSKPNSCVLIFPQGEIQPNMTRPLKFFGGLGKLVEKLNECNVIPIGLKLEFLGEFKPVIFAKVGQAENFALQNKEKTTIEKFQSDLTGVLDNLNSDIISGKTKKYHKVF